MVLVLGCKQCIYSLNFQLAITESRDEKIRELEREKLEHVETRKKICEAMKLRDAEICEALKVEETFRSKIFEAVGLEEEKP